MGILIYTSQLLKLQLPMEHLRNAAGWMAALLILLLPVSGYSDGLPGEYNLKSAFIYNFAKYVEWPENVYKGSGDFCIATLGRSPLDRELATLSGRSVNGRNIVLRQYNSSAEASQCQVLFVSRSEQARLGKIVESLGDLPVLIIVDRDYLIRK